MVHISFEIFSKIMDCFCLWCHILSNKNYRKLQNIYIFTKKKKLFQSTFILKVIYLLAKQYKWLETFSHSDDFMVFFFPSFIQKKKNPMGLYLFPVVARRVFHFYEIKNKFIFIPFFFNSHIVVMQYCCMSFDL